METNQQFFCNYPNEERIATYIIDFFNAELLYARSQPKKHTVWIISPWITESTFDLVDRGSLEDILPGYFGSSIQFSDVLKQLLDFGTHLKIVCKPPHELFNIRNFHKYASLKKDFDQIEEHFSSLKKLQQNLSELNSNAREQKKELGEELRELEHQVRGFRRYLDIEKNKAIGRTDVIELVQSIRNYAPDQVQVSYNDRIHAKLLIGKYGAVFGSSNLTFSGLNFNDELVAYYTDPEILQQLHSLTYRFSGGKRWTYKSERYSIERALQNEIKDYKLDKILRAKLPEEMVHALEVVGLSYIGPKKTTSEGVSPRYLTRSAGLNSTSIPKKNPNPALKPSSETSIQENSDKKTKNGIDTSDKQKRGNEPKLPTKEIPRDSAGISITSNNSENTVKIETSESNYEIGEYNGYPTLRFISFKHNKIAGKSKWRYILDAFDQGILDQFIQFSENYRKNSQERTLDGQSENKWYVQYPDGRPVLCIVFYNLGSDRFCMMEDKARNIISNIETIRKCVNGELT